MAAASPAKTRTADTHSTPAPKPTPAVAEVPSKAPPARINPALLAKLAQQSALSEPPAKTRPPEPPPTPAAKLKMTPSIAEIPLAKIPPAPTPAPVPPKLAPAGPVSNRYPWKTDIVTTIFWIGEPVGGHNFTPNFASSWDSHWTQAYGGFDTPDPNARRNYIPVKFTPRQNPFYCALPYNDVTRGTTKPEARHVIPWFKEAFRKEGESVCHDRWIAIRSRSGKVAYAQWSDCGPFRTDHWQYVFGNEKPKPNLNKGAGLDVSPAVRDFLDLGSTDVTDWKFVDTKDVPSGPWALYGQNNTVAARNSRGPKTAAKESRRPAPGAGQIRVSEL